MFWYRIASILIYLPTSFWIQTLLPAIWLWSCFSLCLKSPIFLATFLYSIHMFKSISSTKSSLVTSAHVDFTLFENLWSCFLIALLILVLLLLLNCKALESECQSLYIFCIPLNTELRIHHRSWKLLSC